MDGAIGVVAVGLAVLVVVHLVVADRLEAAIDARAARVGAVRVTVAVVVPPVGAGALGVLAADRHEQPLGALEVLAVREAVLVVVHAVRAQVVGELVPAAVLGVRLALPVTAVELPVVVVVDLIVAEGEGVLGLQRQQERDVLAALLGVVHAVGVFAVGEPVEVVVQTVRAQVVAHLVAQDGPRGGLVVATRARHRPNARGGPEDERAERPPRRDDPEPSLKASLAHLRHSAFPPPNRRRKSV